MRRWLTGLIALCLLLPLTAIGAQETPAPDPLAGWLEGCLAGEGGAADWCGYLLFSQPFAACLSSEAETCVVPPEQVDAVAEMQACVLEGDDPAACAAIVRAAYESACAAGDDACTADTPVMDAVEHALTFTTLCAANDESGVGEFLDCADYLQTAYLFACVIDSSNAACSVSISEGARTLITDTLACFDTSASSADGDRFACAPLLAAAYALQCIDQPDTPGCVPLQVTDAAEALRACLSQSGDHAICAQTYVDTCAEFCPAPSLEALFGDSGLDPLATEESPLPEIVAGTGE